MFNTTGQTGTKILLDAMSKDKVHLARFVLDALDGEIVDSTADGAQTPLISSILLPDDQTRCKFIELLLQRGASVNYQDVNGRTALSYACEKGYLDAVKILVQNGADPEILDFWGNTPLMYAAVADHNLVVEFLVRAFKRLGLQIDRQNRAGNSAVEVAKFLGHTECISALTNVSKRSREADEGEFERKVNRLANKLEVLQMDILLTPILPNKCETERGGEKSFRARRFNECYYRKRCSLPTSMLSPTPPARILESVRKSRTVRRRNESISLAEPLQFTTASSSTATTFSALTNKLFRRFTSPEFRKVVVELEQNQVPIGRIPRSETFPQDTKHPRVDSKPSVDSISSVNCEFDFHFRETNS
ncbi:hypothetical protein XENOCAPTIV_010922 [Xenoophorus captivus]|uniref:Uncharacterized protein n=1 Tax=Xenoophorus captivus TaxID=1517983 RepID=A0ABV0RC43_9TELE